MQRAASLVARPKEADHMFAERLGPALQRAQLDRLFLTVVQASPSISRNEESASLSVYSETCNLRVCGEPFRWGPDRRVPQAAPNSCSPGWGRGRLRLNLCARR